MSSLLRIFKRCCKHRLCDMLVPLLVLTLIPCLISADITCPDGIISCSQGQKCCFESGHYACCDEDEDEILTPGVLSMSMMNITLDSIQNGVPYSDYCPNKSGRRLCCNPPDKCYAFSECCNSLGTCCISGMRCCGKAEWCCLKSQRCGPRYNTCRATGMTFVPEMGMIALLALAAIKIRYL